MENKISEKLKKVYDSTDIIKKAEKNRIKNLEAKKLRQYTSFHSSLMELKEKIKEDKEKKKEKTESVKENISVINRSFVEQNKDLSMRLMEKYKKISDKNKDKFSQLNEFIHKRKNSINKVNENSFLNRMYFSRLGDNIRKYQHTQNKKSVERNKSLDMSKEIIK